MQMSLGEVLRLTLFGTSHGPRVGAYLEGVPKGITINPETIQLAMNERKPEADMLVSAESLMWSNYYLE